MSQTLLSNVQCSTRIITTITEASSLNNKHLLEEAASLGINTSAYCKTDEKGNIEITDKIGLQTAIKEAKEKTNNSNNSKNDEFIKLITSEDEEITNAEKIKANSYKDDFEAKIQETEAEFYALINGTAKNMEEENIQSAWEETERMSIKLISVTASNTTVLEGAKEFINKLCGFTRDAESIVSNNDNSDEQDKIQYIA